MKDGCEWNPKENRPTYMGEESHAQAEIILGDGTWRVCKECSKLPIFANVHYKVTPITHKETMNEYRIATEAEKEEADVYEDYELLIGPNNFQCALTEPEDRTFHRDLKPIIEELNRLWNLTLSQRE